MNTLEDLAELQREEVGGEDEPTKYAYSNMESFLKVVVENKLPEPNLCGFCGCIIAEWKANGRTVRLRCAGEAKEQAYIYFRGEGVSGIIDVTNESLIERLHWLAGTSDGDNSGTSPQSSTAT
jgi:hypothetical protein